MNLKWEVQRRLEEIERRIFWGGKFSWSDLTKKFNISVQQAPADISQYQPLVPKNIIFNRSLRLYEPVEHFSPILIPPAITDYINWQESRDDSIEHVSMPLREVKLPALREIANTLHQEKSVKIIYQSMSNKGLQSGA